MHATHATRGRESWFTAYGRDKGDNYVLADDDDDDDDDD